MAGKRPHVGRRGGIWGTLLLAAVLAVAWWTGAWQPGDGRPAGPGPSPAPAPQTPGAPSADRLPPEARATLRLIRQGGPFAHAQDGSVFENRERRLPRRPAGYYREYTVATPGERDRGARRIVAGGDPPEVYFYTDDHYRTFRKLEGAP